MPLEQGKTDFEPRSRRFRFTADSGLESDIASYRLRTTTGRKQVHNIPGVSAGA